MFRKLLPADAALLAAFDAELPHAETQRSTDEFRSFLSQASGLGYALEEPQGLVAYALFTQATTQADLCHIVVAPAQRGLGVGRQLLQASLQTLGQLGVRQVFLEVRAGHTPAEQLYARFGAQQVGERPNYYPLPQGGKAPARVLRINL